MSSCSFFCVTVFVLVSRLWLSYQTITAWQGRLYVSAVNAVCRFILVLVFSSCFTTSALAAVCWAGAHLLRYHLYTVISDRGSASLFLGLPHVLIWLLVSAEVSVIPMLTARFYLGAHFPSDV